jgi:hypothetical protein
MQVPVIGCIGASDAGDCEFIGKSFAGRVFRECLLKFIALQYSLICATIGMELVSLESSGPARMRHVISVLLQNEVGALTRMTGLFSTRGYNIESLNVAPTHDPLVSRVTLVI